MCQKSTQNLLISEIVSTLISNYRKLDCLPGCGLEYVSNQFGSWYRCFFIWDSGAAAAGVLPQFMVCDHCRMIAIKVILVKPGFI